MKTVVCRENSCSFEVKAPKDWSLNKIKIDGGLITGNLTERCDYAVLASKSENKNSFFFIELKGTDLRKAISQLETSVLNLSDLHAGYENKYARAICTRIIPFISSEAQVSAIRFRKKYGFCLKWHSQQGSQIIKN